MKPINPGGERLVGVFLALTGAFLDFYSGYQILTQSAMVNNEMGMVLAQYTTSGLAWGVGLLALGAVLLVTALASATSLGTNHMRTLGALMALYGVVMLFVGASMYGGVTPTMQGATLSGLGMLAVGTLMVLNGFLMRRSGRMPGGS